MRIGIDLDNTIICYDKAFLKEARKRNIVGQGWDGGKKKLQKFLEDADPSGVTWQGLQGSIYGKSIWNAEIFQGVRRFLWRCKSRGIEVHVVSHKTRFGHFDPDKTPLRDVALKFLNANKLYSDKSPSLLDSVTCASTLEEKVEHIRQESFDWFIDDLAKVFHNPRFPSSIKTILFSPNDIMHHDKALTCESWGEIESEILGGWSDEELLRLAERCHDSPALSSKWLGGRGNSGIALIEYAHSKLAILKIYSDDEQHDRLFSEFDGLCACHKVGISKIPRPIGKDQSLSVATYEYIPEVPAAGPIDSVEDVAQVLGFLAFLHEKRNEPVFREFPKASAACMSGSDVDEQIKARVLSFAHARTESPILDNYFKQELIPFHKKYAAVARERWNSAHGFDENLPYDQRTLSPSDFGFHNAIRHGTKGLVFIDFEYFGWDDPAKLAADFLLHPGMMHSLEIQKQWFNGVVSIYGPSLTRRLVSLWPLFSLCWCLILLNEFRRDGWVRRRRAMGIDDSARDRILGDQIDKSRSLLTLIDESAGVFPQTE
jgi:hypothetical protein